MIPLDSPRWASLHHAYGSAADIPELLRSLTRSDAAYDELWSALCHQGTIYTASYAALPYLIDALDRDPERAQWTVMLLAAAIEIARAREDSPPIPDDLEQAYFDALKEAPRVIARASSQKWDHSYAASACALLAASTGNTDLAEAITLLDPNKIEELIEDG